MYPVMLFEIDPKGKRIETDDLPSMVDPNKLLDVTGTILDPKIVENGSWIYMPIVVSDYAGREVMQVRVPPIEPLDSDGLWLIHPVMMAANQLIRVIKQFQNGQTSEIAVHKTFSSYQMQVIRSLAGKSGVIRNVVIGARIKRSGRAVLVPNSNHEPEWVGLPGRLFDDAELKHGDYVMIGRDPTIWDGSIEILRARKSDGDVGELHPLLFSQLNADCDGDAIYWFPVPKDPGCQIEAREHLMEFCLQHGRWKKQALKDHCSETVNWDNVRQETVDRFPVDGFSVSPEDIAGSPQGLWETIGRTTGKGELQDACREMAQGLEFDHWYDRVLEKNLEMLRMKVMMGPIGAACNRLKVLAGWNPMWLKSANYLSERLQQMLLDSKHGSGYDPNYVLRILNQQGKWKKASPTDALAELEHLGMDPQEAQTMVEVIYLTFPAYMALDELLSETINKKRYMRLLRQTGSLPIEKIGDRIVRYMREDGLGKEMIQRFWDLMHECQIGLKKLTMLYCPLHEMTAGDLHAHGLAVRIFANKERDRFGVCKKAWNVHEKRLVARKG